MSGRMDDVNHRLKHFKWKSSQKSLIPLKEKWGIRVWVNKIRWSVSVIQKVIRFGSVPKHIRTHPLCGCHNASLQMQNLYHTDKARLTSAKSNIAQ